VDKIQVKKVTDFYKMEGVADIKPMKARGYFAKALMLEHNAGKCTPEAEAALDQAIAAQQ
jgi:hypothetical protein